MVSSGRTYNGSTTHFQYTCNTRKNLCFIYAELWRSNEALYRGKTKKTERRKRRKVLIRDKTEQGPLKFGFGPENFIQKPSWLLRFWIFHAFVESIGGPQLFCWDSRIVIVRSWSGNCNKKCWALSLLIVSKLNKKKYNTILPKSNTTMAPGHCLRYEPLGIWIKSVVVFFSRNLYIWMVYGIFISLIGRFLKNLLLWNWVAKWTEIW